MANPVTGEDHIDEHLEIDLWKNNTIQFARLLSEIWAVGLTKKQETNLGESMDLSLGDIAELFQLAESVFQESKDTLGRAAVTPKRIRDTQNYRLFAVFVNKIAHRVGPSDLLPILTSVRTLLDEYHAFGSKTRSYNAINAIHALCAERGIR